MLSIRELYKIGYGPSSSHTIGCGLAGEIFMERNKNAGSWAVTLYGSLAATGRGHNTDAALKKVFEPNEIEIRWKPEINLPLHPNGMVFEAYDSRGEKIDSWEVYSTGGGDLKDTDGRIKRKNIYKHDNLSGIIKYCKKEGRSLWEYIEENEGKEIWEYLEKVWEAMKASIKRGIEKERVLPGSIRLGRKAGIYHTKSGNSNESIRNIGLRFSYALAVSEENASGGRVVTAPTCGSSGVLPSVLYFLQKQNDLPVKRIVRGLATAGLIGNIVKTNASVSGAEAGCQAEIGTASAMAAAAATQILGGSVTQIEYAAEMGIEHNLGLTCDPVGGYVQIPCIERNAIAAGKAFECAVYAIFSDGGHKIAFDQVVKTMAETGRDMQIAYRETGIGGLAKSWQPFR